MSTPQHLNTTVKGSVGMLQEAARALNRGHQAADDADEAHHQARDIAHTNWRGQGGAAFLEDLQPHLNTTRDLAATCEAYKRAFEDLAGTLEVVNNDMEKVRSTATAGGLEVHGPIVMRPEHPGPAPSTAQYAGKPAEHKAAMTAYGAQVDDFNAKAQVFNNCLAIFTDARNKEKQGHTDFWRALEAGQGFNLEQAWNIGTTTASSALNGLASMHNARSDLLTKVQQLQPQSQTYQALASGNITLRGMSAKQRMQVMGDLARTKGSEVSYRRQIKQLDKVAKYLPDGLPRAAAAGPGDIKASSKLGQQVSKAFKKLPWAGSALTVFNEMRGAATGSQTWGRAVADSVGIVGGSTAGGTAGMALCAPLVPPAGPVLCGIGGALVGGFAGDKVVDFVVPEDTGMPKQVAPVPDHPNAPPLYPK